MTQKKAVPPGQVYDDVRRDEATIVSRSPIENGWSEDATGLPMYSVSTLDLAAEDWKACDANEDEARMQKAAIASSVSRDSRYGDAALLKLAEKLELSYSVVRNYKRVYERVQELQSDARASLFNGLKSGSVVYSNVRAAMAVEDDETFVRLATLTRENSRPASKTQVKREAAPVIAAQRERHLVEVARANAILDEQRSLYRTVVVDPPWNLKKIQRRGISNLDWPYATMTEAELANLAVMREFPAAHCHLYLWFTHSTLHAALRLCEAWGFRYHCMLTWVKNRGFVPYSWMYSTEHVLFCIKGGLKLQRLGKRLDFTAKVRDCPKRVCWVVIRYSSMHEKALSNRPLR